MDGWLLCHLVYSEIQYSFTQMKLNTIENKDPVGLHTLGSDRKSRSL